ncbi:MAG: hypothetical protein AMXMBFR48_00830 [Ignavibacteriales bacterium]
MKLLLPAIIVVFFQYILIGQDTTRYPWPINPNNVQKQVGGSFGEYRSTSADGHYHNGTDISGSAGTPVYAVIGGQVGASFDDGNTGYDSYVRINSTINGQTKMLTYYHTRPIANLAVGQMITAGQQISTIAIDHVHLIEYRFGITQTAAQINSLRPNGGLIPYNDPWKPYIRYVKFLRDNSDLQLPAGNLGGKIDIIAHVEETNGTTSATFNNGTYEIGYKVLSEDGQTVIHNPPDNGLRFKYYGLPRDQYVNVNYYRPESNTSKHVYIVTNGSGAANVASTQVVSNNYFDADAYPYGNYKVMVFTYDTRGHGDTVYIPVTTAPADLNPPAAPLFKSILRDSTNYFTLRWTAPADGDLKGFRIHYSNDGTTFQVRESENTLTSLITNRTYSYGLPNPLYLKVFAVDTANPANLSVQSDVYGIRSINDGKKILIVDGFNRFLNGGSYNLSYHDFIIRFAESASFSFETVHHSAIKNGEVDLSGFQTVFWMSGDENPAEPVFTPAEMNSLKLFLEGGGNLFLSGSEIAQNLYQFGAQDSTLLRYMKDYLKIQYAYGDANLNYAIVSDSTAVFSNALIPFGLTAQGSPYLEDAPDVITGEPGTTEFIKYNVTKPAGIYYSGTFGQSSNQAKLVFLGFPFETIGSIALRTQFMTDLLKFFYPVSSIHISDETNVPEQFEVYQNYPNPFNPSTRLKFYNPSSGKVKIVLYNIIGEHVYTVADKIFAEGYHEFTMNFSDEIPALVSGTYIARFETVSGFKSVKILYLK